MKLRVKLKRKFYVCNSTVTWYRSSYQEMFLRKGVLKICSKFTGEHPCQSVISIKLQSNRYRNMLETVIQLWKLKWILKCFINLITNVTTVVIVSSYSTTTGIQFKTMTSSFFPWLLPMICNICNSAIFNMWLNNFNNSLPVCLLPHH